MQPKNKAALLLKKNKNVEYEKFIVFTFSF